MSTNLCDISRLVAASDKGGRWHGWTPVESRASLGGLIEIFCILAGSKVKTL